MPVKWLVGPQGERVEFADAPTFFEGRGIMPAYAVEAILGDIEEEGSFNVRPSDVNPKFVCRRQRVWKAGHEFGESPLALEAMLEGSGFHMVLGAHEIVVPRIIDTNADDPRNTRIEILGVPMRGRIDWLFPDRIEDLKTKAPFWAVKFATKEEKLADPQAKPYAYIWEPKNDDDDILGWTIQLSIYRVLLEKSGQAAPSMGRVWRRLGGVKADQKRWKRYDFPLMDEEGLETVVGEWVRSLSKGLAEAKVDPEAWKLVEADGRQMIGSRGNYWACDRCPLKDDCFKHEGLDVW